MSVVLLFFFFNDTATTEIYTLSLHDALPIWARRGDSGRAVLTLLADDLVRAVSLLKQVEHGRAVARGLAADDLVRRVDRKSTRLNSSHANISYAVFCLKKKKKTNYNDLSLIK